MNTSRHVIVAALIGLTGWAVLAQTTTDHSQHHPQAAQTPPAASQEAMTDPSVAAMDSHMQRMRDISQKLANAKSPQERQAIMAEHHHAMHEGMKMMGQMRSKQMPTNGMMSGTHKHESSQGGSPGHAQMMGGMMQRHTMMEKRMEMMETMMQMMMDRMPAPASQ